MASLGGSGPPRDLNKEAPGGQRLVSQVLLVCVAFRVDVFQCFDVHSLSPPAVLHDMYIALFICRHHIIIDKPLPLNYI